jgi:hypothetical protein
MSFEIGGDPSAIIGSGAGESGCLISRTVSATVPNIRECVTSSMRSRNEVANELSIRSMRLRA